MTTDTDPPLRRGLGRWGRLALAISLCVNLLIVGAAVGAALRFDHWNDRGHGGGMTIWRMMRALPDEARDRAHDMAEARRDAYEALRDQRRDLRRRAAELIGAEPFDAAALTAAQAAYRQNRDARRAMVDALIVDLAAQLSAADRAALAESMAHRWRRHRWRRDRWR